MPMTTEKIIPVAILTDSPCCAAAIPDALEKAIPVPCAVQTVNWKEYPYRPEVEFRIAHDGENIFLQWRVIEEEIKAVCETDGGEVWCDSCVEFFITFDGSHYYNIETNCIGTVLAAYGAGRNDRRPLSAELTAKIDRHASLSRKPLENGTGGEWELALKIPAEIFMYDRIKSLSGLEAKANFYKCGDGLKRAHFVSWAPIDTPAPDFHCPEFFARIRFEGHIVP